jgi:hypothetical protein
MPLTKDAKAEEQPEIALQLHANLEKYPREIGARMPTPNPRCESS